MDRVIERLRALLTTHVKSTRGIKQIYNGEPAMIPEDSLPAIIITGNNGWFTPTLLDTQKQIDEYSINIEVRTTAKKTLNQAFTEDTAEREVRKIVEERDDATNKPKADTVLGMLQQVFKYDEGYSQYTTVGQITKDNSAYPNYSANIPILVKGKEYNIR